MRLFIVLAALSITFVAHGQWYVLKKKQKVSESSPFQKDENGKIIFYEVVAVDTVPRDTLWKNAKSWMSSILNEKKDKVTFEEYLSGTIEANTSFMVYTTSLVSKMPHGMIFYKVAIDVKDKKYRYAFTDFTFQFYKQDRKDFKYKPVKGYVRPLEKDKYPGYQSTWDQHKLDLKKRVEGQIKNLKQEIVKSNKPAPPDSVLNKPVIKTKDW